jgi:hypothetical protein
MEAVNRGAHETGGASHGRNIVLPQDTRDNFFTPNRGTYLEATAGLLSPALDRRRGISLRNRSRIWDSHGFGRGMRTWQHGTLCTNRQRLVAAMKTRLQALDNSQQETISYENHPARRR